MTADPGDSSTELKFAVPVDDTRCGRDSCGETEPSWWLAHAKSLVKIWREEQSPENGKTLLLYPYFEVYEIRHTRSTQKEVKINKSNRVHNYNNYS